VDAPFGEANAQFAEEFTLSGSPVSLNGESRAVRGPSTWVDLGKARGIQGAVPAGGPFFAFRVAAPARPMAE